LCLILDEDRVVVVAAEEDIAAVVNNGTLVDTELSKFIDDPVDPTMAAFVVDILISEFKILEFLNCVMLTD